MSLRRLILILLAVAVVVPVGVFVRHQWHEAQVCEREFGPESTDYEICTQYGSNPEGFCSDLGRSPFRCSEDYIAGHRKLVAARNAGLYQVRLECTAVSQVSGGSRCSPEQWERYCAQRHSGDRVLPRCLEAGPDGPEGVPPGELQAKVAIAGGPQSGPRTECGTVTTYEARGLQPAAVAVDDDGSVWFTEPAIGALSHMTLDGKVSRRFLGPSPGKLVRSPGGDLWFTAALGRVDSGGAITYHALPGSGSRWPESLIAGPDGAIWFLDAPAKTAGRMSADGAVTEFAAPGLEGSTSGTQLAVGANSLWFAQPGANSLSRITCS